jgi:hypothetical protein
MEMPLNHLGLKVVHWDIRKGVPDLAHYPDLRGVIVHPAGVEGLVPEALYTGISAAMDRGLRVVFFDAGGDDRPVYIGILRKMSIVDERSWVGTTYKTRITDLDARMIGFERPLPKLLPSYPLMRVLPGGAVSHLQVLDGSATPARQADLVVTSAQGGFIADGYGLFYEEVVREVVRDGEKRKVFLERLQWHINPFLFFKYAFATDDLPKPDVTTLAGRRMFYSHIDGDGWNNLSEVEAHRGEHLTSPEVLLKEVIQKYPDIPVTIGVIAGDIDRSCYGVARSEQVLHKLLAQPNVELASHTYTHPFNWDFFHHYTPAKEEAFLDRYPDKPIGAMSLVRLLGLDGWENWFSHTKIAGDVRLSGEELRDYSELKSGHDIPRAYACMDFDTHKEVAGSIEFLNALAPKGKRVTLLQWSGDTRPFEEAVRLTRELGVENINGGDARLDPEYPSYAWLSPIGRQVGAERQIYSSNSNENTYTNLWTDRFYGFKHLLHTIENTESPMRVKPINVYFHMYSGDKVASLNAVRANLDYAQGREIIPVHTSAYAKMARGFYTTELVPVGHQRWKIQKRGALQVVRFDDATGKSVDFNQSSGVVGQRVHQGSLYVYLDSARPVPVIGLTDLATSADAVLPPIPYLRQSSWQVSHLARKRDSVQFQVEGFGAGMMQWQMAERGDYVATLKVKSGKTERLSVSTDDDGFLVCQFKTRILDGPGVVAIQKKH